MEDNDTGLLVSNLGRIVSKEGNVLKLTRSSKDGYYRVGAGGKLISVHRLIARNFIPNPLNLPCINHKDEDKTNNSLSNLEWCTYKYNSNYGTIKKRTLETSILREYTCPIEIWKGNECHKFNTTAECANFLGCSRSCSNRLYNKQIKYIGLWHLKNTPDRKIYTLYNGKKEITFLTILEGARKAKISRPMISELLQKQRFSCKGWHLKDETRRNQLEHYKIPIVLEKEGVQYKFSSQQEAIESINVSIGQFYNFLKIKGGKIKGYRLVSKG